MVSVEEYIARFVERGEKPTCEYVDGELIPKPKSSHSHSRVQANLLIAIGKDFGKSFDLLPELTVQLSASKFYVPDIAVDEASRRSSGPYPGPNEPVFLCIEIKSSEESIGKLFSKCSGYHSWGVANCWVIDPETKAAWEYARGDQEPRKAGSVLTAGVIQLPLCKVFRTI